MNKVIYALALFAVATVANAVPVTFVVHNQTSGTSVSTLVADGTSLANRLPAAYGGAVGAVTATFDWDGTTLTSVGNYGVATHIGSNPNAGAILGQRVTDLSIDTSTSTAGGTAYSCTSGDFLLGVGFNVCGGYSFGGNYVDDSTASWGPGLATSLTLGGDDVFTGGPQTVSAFDLGLMLWDGTTLVIGNGAGLGAPLGGEQICFSTDGSSAGCGILVPVPAAAWLFGSALGLLGWARRRVA